MPLSSHFILETPRLIVCQYTMEESDAFYALNSDEEVVRYMRLPKNRKECDAFLIQIINFYNSHPNLGRWAAFEKITKEYIGSFAIIPINEETGNIKLDMH